MGLFWLLKSDKLILMYINVTESLIIIIMFEQNFLFSNLNFANLADITLEVGPCY